VEQNLQLALRVCDQVHVLRAVASSLLLIAGSLGERRDQNRDIWGSNGVVKEDHGMKRIGIVRRRTLGSAVASRLLKGGFEVRGMTSARAVRRFKLKG